VNHAVLAGVARRLAGTVVTLFGVAVVVFLILRRLPGDAVTASMGVSVGLLTPAQRHALDQFYGVGQPALQQFWSWLHSTLTGNLGISLSAQQPVSKLIGHALPVTLELGIASLVLGLAIGVALGVLGGLRPGKVGDDVGQGVAVVGLGIPSFVLGTGLVTFLSSEFQYFPSSQGYVSLFHDPWLNVQQIFFPALVLSLGIGAAIMRTTRTAVLEVSVQNFVRTARGKGLSGRSVVWRHVFLNALVPVVTMSGIQLGYLLGGTVIIEQIYVLPGLGRLLVTSINNRDFPVVQSLTMLFATGFVVVNMLVDLVCALIDPRVRR
jgi:peptide/nickel transport system permease protein